MQKALARWSVLKAMVIEAGMRILANTSKSLARFSNRSSTFYTTLTLRATATATSTSAPTFAFASATVAGRRSSGSLHGLAHRIAGPHQR
jgi:hypothetical protein